jgi:hypothetical protein
MGGLLKKEYYTDEKMSRRMKAVLEVLYLVTTNHMDGRGEG